MDEIETINIELEHSVAKLLSEKELLHKEIEHLKKIYKDQFDSIKKTRALCKEHCDSLISQLNSKSMENADLKGQIQEKVFVTTALQNELRRLKGKNVLDNVTTIANATTIAPGMFKLNLDPLAPRLLKNRDAHIDYLKYTQEQADILWEIVEQAKAKQPLDNALDFAYPICDANVKHAMLNANSELICVKCKQCMFDANHDVCFLDFVNDVNVRSKSKLAKQSQQHNIWKPMGKVFTKVGYKWKPTGKLFTLVGNSCPLTRFTSANLVPSKETTSYSVEKQKPEIKVYSRRPKQVKTIGLSKKAKIVESKIANNSEPNHSWGSNATDVPSSYFLVNDSKFMGTVRFGNDQIAKIMVYGDYQLGNNLEGVDLLLRSRDTNLYTISLDDMLNTSPIYLLSKASKTKSWLWHRQLSHLNFGTLNKLAKDGLARGISKLKFKKDHLSGELPTWVMMNPSSTITDDERKGSRKDCERDLTSTGLQADID
ncbi:retrovirus-related pol polyprotein from transposon TNT 1-94 [Tanacetum coccineum]